MWPFGRRRDPSLVIHNHLEDGPSVPAPNSSATDAVRATTKTVAKVHHLSALHLQALITEAASLEGKLAGLLPDLEAPHGNLGTFAGDVEAAYQRLKYTVGQSPDIILRRITVGENLKWPALVAFADGMVDNEIVDQDTVRVMELYRTTEQDTADPNALHATVLRQMVAAGHVTTSSQWDNLLTQLTYGNTLVFVQGNAAVLIIDSVKFQARAIERAKSEPSVKGPQEAFNEILLTHMNQVRRRIRSPWLHFDPISVGGYTTTTVLVVHIEGLTNPALVAAIKDRVRNIRRDTVQELTEVTSYLLDRRSLFPQVRMTERVDWAVRELTRGKVVLMVDNTPFVATLPVTLMDFYQTTQDYVFSFWDGTLVRLVRCLGVILSLFLMPLYIALFSVDPDLVPTKLALTVAGSELGIPFPPVMEVLIMWVIIEILREAANRLPTELAVTLGTVGAVVVGTPCVNVDAPTNQCLSEALEPSADAVSHSYVGRSSPPPIGAPIPPPFRSRTQCSYLTNVPPRCTDGLAAPPTRWGHFYWEVLPMMVHPIRAGPGWWLAGGEEPSLVAALRYAPALLFCPVPSLVAPADPWGDPDDRRVPVLTLAAWAATPTPWPADRPIAVALQVGADDLWPAPNPAVRWWVVSPERWTAAQAVAPAGVTCLATGPVPGPHIDPIGWPLGRWLALARPFADDEEESA